MAGRWVAGLERTPITPDALTISGVGLCIAGSVAVYFEYVSGWFFSWRGALFVIGSILDILDGALARRSGKGTPFGAFLDSTVDRVGEVFMLSAIGLVLMRDGSEWGLAFAFAAIGRLVPRQLHARARRGHGPQGRRRFRQPGRAGRRDLGRPRLRPLGVAALRRSPSWPRPPGSPCCSGCSSSASSCSSVRSSG